MDIDYRLDRPVSLRACLRLRGFTVLVGLSGEGKSSLLKAIAGLLPAEGVPFGGLPPQQRPIGYLPKGMGCFLIFRPGRMWLFRCRAGVTAEIKQSSC